MEKQTRGFTLIELMVVVAIVAIVAAIAYPAYNKSAMKSRRADAKSALTAMATQQERYFTANNAYTTDESKVGGSTSEKGYYTLTASVNGRSYTLTATANSPGPQTNDDGCTTLTLTHTGITSPSDCW